MEAGEKTVVLGAGLGGLSAAWWLATNGRAVCLLEREAATGGLAVTKERDGYRYDLGPHNLHTRHAHILQFMRRHFPSLHEHFPTVHVWRRGALVAYPIRGLAILKSLSVWKWPLAAASWLAARVRRSSVEASFRDWVRNRFGQVIYREYFHDYPQKVWRLPTDQIDKVVAEKRVPTGLRAQPVRNFLLRGGVGELARFFEAGARAGGALVMNQVRPTRVRVEGRRVVAVETDGREMPCGHLLSTIPIGDLIALFEDAPENVRASARALDYCATVLLFLKVARPLPSTVLYFTEPAIRFSRVSDLPAGNGLWCFEFPCAVGDETWCADTEGLATHATSVMVSRGILDEAHGAFVERVTHAYPRFRVGYAEHLARCLDFLGGFENVRTFGRQGGFQYINTDTVMHQGFEAARAVMG